MEMIETETNVVVLNEQPEFITKSNEKVSAKYFIICEEEDDFALSKCVYEYKIAGMSVLNWVVRACGAQPVILKLSKDDDIISQIKPYTNGFDYSVVLYANTPLVSKGHINDLLAFVALKNMNVCKLKKGFVFNNEYISEIEEFYSVDTYDFASDDFFEIKTYEDIIFANEVLTKKILSYHGRNGVYFENSKLSSVDATAEIGYDSTICVGAKVLKNSILANKVLVGVNSIIENSKIGDDVVIGKNVVIEGSVIKSGAVIDDGTIIKGSVIGENVNIYSGCRILDSGIMAESVIANLVSIVNSRLGENVHVGTATLVLGDKEKSIINKESIIGANVKIIDSNLAEETEIDSNKVIINNKKVEV